MKPFYLNFKSSGMHLTNPERFLNKLRVLIKLNSDFSVKKVLKPQ